MMALSGIASTSCSVKKSGSIGDLSMAFAICSISAFRFVVQFFDASSARPCFARVSSAAPPAPFSAGTSARNVSFTSALSAISAP
jgi:hypothetical protein